jgi:hypothetical protein
MEFIQFISIDKIKELEKNDKKYIFFQLITTLDTYVHINTDIYVQYYISKEYKNFTIEKLVDTFLKQPIYIGELINYRKKNKKIYKDTTLMISDIYNHQRIVYYKELFESNKENLYYINNIECYMIISFIKT